MGQNNKLTLSRKDNALKKFPTSGQFLTEMNSTVCMQRYSKLSTPRACIGSNAATLQELEQWYGIDCPRDWLSLQLATLNLFVNVSQHLSERQIPEISFWIYERFPSINIADVTLVISRIKMQGYGPLYNNLSGEFILNCFSEYYKERRSFMLQQEVSKRNAFESIATFEIGIMKHLDKLPRLRKIMQKNISEEERKKIEAEEREQEIKREAQKIYNEEKLKK